MSIYTIFIIVLCCLLLSSFVIVAMLWWNKKNILHMEHMQHMKDKQQKELLTASIEGQENERKRIAENLHDDIGPLLSIINHSLFHSITEGNIDELQDVVRRAIDSVRQISLSLSPTILNELGLNEGITYISHRFIECSVISIDIDWDMEIETKLSTTQTIHVYRIIQEAMNNVINHSNAGNCWIKGKVEEDLIHVNIIDDGIGLVSTIGESSLGLGIQNMKGRVLLLEGTIEFLSLRENHGLEISITIPYDD